MSEHIHKISIRDKLKPRREPYWAAPLGTGRFIGYRKIDAERGSWIARARNEDGTQQYKSLGASTTAFDYDAAAKAAQEWFASLDAGVMAPKGKFTVEDACREYVEDRRREKGENTARDADWRFKHYGIYGTALGRTELIRLRTPTLKSWRNGLKISKAGANRMLNTLRAALNLAVNNRQVAASTAIEWKSIKPYPNADRRRETYLDFAQRRALLAAADGAVRDLIEAVMLTGARPGEVAHAQRSAFDGRTKTLTLSGKTGRRTVPLSPAAIELFERVSKSKLPTAPLLSRPDGKPWLAAEWTVLLRLA
ncbi:MAG TPA: hypothetical protein VJ738_07540 [Steroidobacteraceae bacterium]|nr:hypothetical protein [Steroidobacteraceae bacterium]